LSLDALLKGKDPFKMGYFDNFNNEFLNKYENVLKIENIYIYVKAKGSLDNGYLDNLDNEFLNKYEKNLNNNNNNNSYGYVLILVD
jgi:hypothetical protein